jgi:hypothetical protein
VRNMAAEFWILPTKHLSHARKVLLHAVNLRHGTNSFTSPPKEVVLWIFITLKTPSSSNGFEPANLGSIGKHTTTRPPRATLPLESCNQNPACTSHLSHLCHMPHPSYPPWFDHPNYIRWRAYIMELLIMKFSPASCYFIQVFSSAPSSQTSSICALPFMWKTF